MVTLSASRVDGATNETALASATDNHAETNIPDDWLIKRIGDLRPFVTSGSRGWAMYYSDRGSPFIRITNLSRSRVFLDLHDLRFVEVETTNAEAKRTELRDGDILISITADIGIVGFVNSRLPKPAYINQHVALVRFDSSQTNPLYVSYFLASEKSKKLFRVLTDSGAKAGMNLTTILQIPLVLPSTTLEQDAIAQALSDADALVESLEQLIAKKCRLKQGAMQELLTGKKRLPGFAKTSGYKQSEIGVVPHDWDAKPLGEIGEAFIGLTYKPSDVKPDGVLVLRASNIQDGAVDFDDNVFVSVEVPDNIMVRVGDILICVRNGSRELIGKCALLDERTKGMTFGAFMAVFRTPAYRFVHYQFQSAALKRQINEHLGATINQITNKSLNSFIIPFPQDENEREAIASILSDMDNEIAALEAKLAKARQLKEGMMQELLTGRTRLV